MLKMPVSGFAVLGGLLLAACGGGGAAPAAGGPQPTGPVSASTTAAPVQAGGATCPVASAHSLAELAGCSPAAARQVVLALKAPPPMLIDSSRQYTVILRTVRGDLTLQLDPRVAPVTVNNFVVLASAHYFDGLTFHRVEPGFVIQGGDPGNGPGGPGSGGPSYKLPDESNPSQWPAGTLGMASNSLGVNGSQFFVTTGPAPHLANRSVGVFNHFGQVTQGLAVAAKIQVGDQILGAQVSAS